MIEISVIAPESFFVLLEDTDHNYFSLKNWYKNFHRLKSI